MSRTSQGVLVLGMHRSGTSALSRVLQLSGADIGVRVLGESAGNEAGHWEDAFAVEAHERLLAALGTRWDEALGLSSDWESGEAAVEARSEIRAYIASDRSRHALWAVKDPRLSLFADLWIDAAAEAGQPLDAVLMLRHPLEVAQSLAARDGIAPARGLLLWLEYTLAAAAAAERVPSTLITYDQLLDDWRACVERIRQLPGAGKLRVTAQGAREVAQFLDGNLRHHTEADTAKLPQVIREAWNELSSFATAGEVPPGAIKRLVRRIGPVRQLVHPLLGENRVIQRKLWERIARAEAVLPGAAPSSFVAELATMQTAINGIPAEIKAVAEQVELNRSGLVDAISRDLMHMQAVTSEALQAAAGNEREAEIARQVAPRLQAMEAELLPLAQRAPVELAALAAAVESSRLSLVEAISNDLQHMQAVTSEALQAAAGSEREAEIARQVAPRLQAMEAELLPLAQRAPVELAALAAAVESSQAVLSESLGLHQAALVEAISGDLKRMQGVTSEALEAAEGNAREAEIARQVAPRLQAIEAGLLPLAQRLPAELASLSTAMELNQTALVHAISGELKHMQAVTSEAVRAAGVSEREAQLSHQIEPRLGSLAEGLEGNRKTFLQAISVDLQQMREATSEAIRGLALAEGEANALRELVPRLEVAIASRTRLEAELEARQRDLAGLQHANELLRHKAAELELVTKSHSWRLTRPLRVLRRLATRRRLPSDVRKLRAWLAGLIARVPLMPGRMRSKLVLKALQSGPNDPGQTQATSLARVLQLAPQAAGVPDVFVWAVIDWHFRHQRPQHLAQALAEKGHRVFYVSNNFIDSAVPGFQVEPLDDAGRLFQVFLHHEHAPAIYFGMPEEVQVERMRASLADLLAWTCTQGSLSLVQHPYWSDLLRAVPNARVVYDCMDHHAGFENNATTIMQAEERIIADADLVIVTSGWLEHELGSRARANALIRNAGEFEHFRQAPAKVFEDPRGRPVIGYYGAIAEWFDLALVRKVAEAHPGALVLLIGADTAGAQDVLADLGNVQFTGEVAYDQLPFWLHGFDVCLLPFKVIPLTLATNPVKVYEYLAAGKPTVVVDLPEMSQFGGLVEVAGSHEDFVAAVGSMLVVGKDPAAVAARQAFAAAQTWNHRASQLDDELGRLPEPRVSVIILTYNNLAFTQACLFSVEAYSDYPNLEVMVVDNASSDGSREWLQDWANEPSAAGHLRRLILNDDNLGFSAGNNVGLRAATGEFLVILNNDTYVTPGWVRTLCAHLRREQGLGLVGPTTNNIGNEAKIDIQYADMAEMIMRAGAHTRANPGRSMRMRNAAFFCVAMRRDTYEVVGDMDEDFGVGFFEDDDYCRRIEQAGLEIACAEDVFIHHHLSASFDALGAERKKLLFDRNKAIYESKWGEWKPHAYRNEREAQ